MRKEKKKLQEVGEKVKQKKNEKNKIPPIRSRFGIWCFFFLFFFFSGSFTLLAIMRSHISNVCSRECLCGCTTVLEYNWNSSRVFFFISFFFLSLCLLALLVFPFHLHFLSIHTAVHRCCVDDCRFFSSFSSSCVQCSGIRVFRILFVASPALTLQSTR